MPGILPMKVIKVGTNAQSRIAQACDRCRSKKIRCDGVRPCCSQCANVGFECKTSDKLSRRAFPRGYTESLEERVRSLETEVRELKELLDEKDEKIDMLSRVRSQSSQPLQLHSPRRPSTHSQTSASPRADSSEKDEIFKVQQSPYLLDTFGSDSYFAGTSNARTLIEAFKHTVQESGRSTEVINTELLLASSCRSRPESPSATKDTASFNPPSRMVSDQLVNVFFQEWAPLFPVLHRPAFLTLYERYCADPEDITDKAEQAQLNLVFGIAALSCDSKTSVQDLESFEGQWKAAVDSILSDGSMATLQAFILAQIFCVQKGDLTRLLTYKGLSTSLSARLGLHQSQKRFALGTLTCETRKKVFWSLYTVDCFTAVILGLPKHIKDEDVHCEFPVDADDEYVTEKGFQPTLPGESTKLSSALAFFRAARILSKVLEEVFPAKTSYDLSMKKLSDLQDELDAWSSSLAPHLRLQFAQDKPSTGTISSRSPLLSLTYHYIRALINRPAICAGIGNRASPAMLTHAASCKSMIQLVQLLRERGMSLSFCINRDELLVLSGFGLLYQSLTLDPQSKILKDNQKMVKAVVAILRKTNAPCAPEFSKVADAFLPSASSAASSSSATPKLQVPTISRHNSDPTAPITINPHPSLPASTKKHLKAIANRFTNAARTPRMDAATDYRRATLPNITLHPDSEVAQDQPSLQPPSSTHNRSPVARSEPARSPLNTYGRPPSTGRPSAPPATNAKHKPRQPTKALNLDYLSFGPDTDVSTSSAKASQPINPDPQPTDWEKLLGSLDNGQTNIFDACYGGQPVEALLDSPALSMAAPASVTSVASASTNSINDPAWGQADLWSQLCQTESNTTVGSALTSSPGQADHHLLSFSSTDDLTASRSSADDFKVTPEWIGTITDGGSSKGSSVALGSHSGTYRGIVMPASLDSDDGLSFDSPWNSGLAL